MPDRISVKLGAELLGVGRGVIYRAVRSGRLPAIRIGHQLRINRADIEAFARPVHPDR
ncbi:MAG: helix-turn-helix domain-containing protein [Mycobacteriales bacterium]